MKNEPQPRPEETSLEELANMPLSELVEPEWLELPEIEPQDLVLPYDYIQDLVDRGIITEDALTIDSDSRLLEGPESGKNSMPQDTPNEQDFGR